MASSLLAGHAHTNTGLDRGGGEAARGLLGAPHALSTKPRLVTTASALSGSPGHLVHDLKSHLLGDTRSLPGTLSASLGKTAGPALVHPSTTTPPLSLSSSTLSSRLLSTTTSTQLTSKLLTSSLSLGPRNTNHTVNDAATLSSLGLLRSSALQNPLLLASQFDDTSSEDEQVFPELQTKIFNNIRIYFDTSVPEKSSLIKLAQANGAIVSYALNKHVCT